MIFLIVSKQNLFEQLSGFNTAGTLWHKRHRRNCRFVLVCFVFSDTNELLSMAFAFNRNVESKVMGSQASREHGCKLLTRFQDLLSSKFLSASANSIFLWLFTAICAGLFCTAISDPCKPDKRCRTEHALFPNCINAKRKKNFSLVL